MESCQKVFSADPKKLCHRSSKQINSVQGERRIKSTGRALSRRGAAVDRELLQEQTTSAEAPPAAGQGAAGRQRQRHQPAQHLELPLPAAARHFMRALRPPADCD